MHGNGESAGGRSTADEHVSVFETNETAVSYRGDFTSRDPVNLVTQKISGQKRGEVGSRRWTAVRWLRRCVWLK